MDSVVALAKLDLCPLIDPELSTNITISFGEVAAETYQLEDRKSYMFRAVLGLCQTVDMSSGGQAIPKITCFNDISVAGLIQTWISPQKTTRASEKLPGKGGVVLVVVDKNRIQMFRPLDSVHNFWIYKELKLNEFVGRLRNITIFIDRFWHQYRTKTRIDRKVVKMWIWR